MITKEKAIEIARAAIQGHAETQPGSPITVDMKNDQFVVTFVHINPPGTRGADFDAQVTINPQSGQVVQILGG